MVKVGSALGLITRNLVSLKKRVIGKLGFVKNEVKESIIILLAGSSLETIKNEKTEIDEKFKELSKNKEKFDKKKSQFEAKEKNIGQQIKDWKTRQIQLSNYNQRLRNEIQILEETLKDNKEKFEKFKEMSEEDIEELEEDIQELEEENAKLTEELKSAITKTEVAEERIAEKWEETITLSENDGRCVICLKEHAATHALIPCGHRSYCIICCEKISECSICKKHVESSMRIF